MRSMLVMHPGSRFRCFGQIYGSAHRIFGEIWRRGSNVDAKEMDWLDRSRRERSKGYGLRDGFKAWFDVNDLKDVTRKGVRVGC